MPGKRDSALGKNKKSHSHKTKKRMEINRLRKEAVAKKKKI
ncbi:MAG: hypothetical protein AAB451_01505 [Patescibacteria group bacterium]